VGFAQDEDDPRRLPRSSSKCVLAAPTGFHVGLSRPLPSGPRPWLSAYDLRPSRSSVSGLRPYYAHVPSLQTIHSLLIMRCTFPWWVAWHHSMFCLYKRGSRPTSGYSKVKSKERCTLRAKGLIVVSTGKFKERCTLRAKGLPSGNQPDPLRHRSSRPREST
jgi:hypothetical protein